MADALSRGVFLSYRREDAGPYARTLQLQLTQRLPEVPVFIDLDSIEAGTDFAEAIEDAVNSCAVLVALIGRQWATLTYERYQDDADRLVDLIQRVLGRLDEQAQRQSEGAAADGALRLPRQLEHDHRSGRNSHFALSRGERFRPPRPARVLDPGQIYPTVVYEASTRNPPAPTSVTAVGESRHQ